MPQQAGNLPGAERSSFSGSDILELRLGRVRVSSRCATEDRAAASTNARSLFVEDMIVDDGVDLSSCEYHGRQQVKVEQQEADGRPRLL